MRIVDLTHVIEPDMPVFPGTEAPVLVEANTIARDGFAEKKVTFFSHTGTHMDALAHMLAGAKTLDAYSASDFYGRAVLADSTGQPLEQIEVSHLAALEDKLRQAHFLILRTGWAEWWGKPEYFAGFPALSPAAAGWVIGLGIRGVGVDAISIDRMETNGFPVHHLLFKAGLFVIENLTHLEQVEMEFTLACLPLKIRNADGAPARVVAVCEDRRGAEGEK